MDELLIDSRDESSLVEETSVVAASSAFGLGSAALFFRSGYGRNLNKFVAKSRYMMRDFPGFVDENISDLSNIGGLNPSDILNKLREDWNNQQEADFGYSYFATNQPQWNAFENYYRNIGNQDTLFRKLYSKEVEAIGRDRLNKYNGFVLDSVYEAVSTEIEKLVLSSSNIDTKKSIANLASKLSGKKYDSAVALLEDVVLDMEDFISKNSYLAWKESEYASNLFQSAQKAIFDPTLWKEKQVRDKNSVFGIFSNILNSDKNLTVKDIIDISQSNDREKIDTLRKIFKNSNVFLGTDDHSFLRYGADQSIMATGLAKEKAESMINILDLIEGHDNLLQSPGTNRKLAEDFRNLEFDNIKIDKNGNIYSISDTKSFLSDFFNSIGSLFPFNMFHINEVLSNYESPNTVDYISAASDENLQAILKDLGYDPNSKVQISGEEMFIVQKDGSLKKIDELSGKFTRLSTKTGWTKKIVNTYFGGEPYKEIDPNEDLGFIKNLFENELGIGIERIERTKEFGNNYENYGTFNRRIVRNLENTLSIIQNEKDVTSEQFKQAMSLSKGFDRYKQFLKKNSREMSQYNAKKLADLAKDEYSARYLRYISRLNSLEDAREVIVELSKSKNSLTNPALAKLVSFYEQNPANTEKGFKTYQDTSRRSSGKYRSVNFINQLSEELEREFYLKYMNSPEGSKNLSDVFHFLNENLRGEALVNAKNMAATTVYFNKTNAYVYGSFEESFEKVVQGIKDINEDKDIGGRALKEQLGYINRKFGFFEDINGISLKNQVQKDIGDFIILRKNITIDHKSILRDINQGYFERAGKNLIDQTYHFGKQFFAGADDPRHFTPISIATGMFFERLNSMLNSFDEIEFSGLGLQKTFGLKLKLGLSPKDTKSSWDIAKNLMIKRALPVYGTFKAIEVLDDFFGTSGMVSSGLANSNLGFRKIFDFIGLSSGLDSILKDNAFAQYVSGASGHEAGFNTYEEEKKYYERGYDAVRKARYWTFGSTNEFRGGKIAYWEPNDLRQATSKWEFNSLYEGSLLTKYNFLYHAINPYWLEELHSEDRPYPYSATLFDEKTPWGIALNATIGDIWKPRIRLHQERLGPDGVDVKALIYHVNSQLRERADQDILYIQRGKLSAYDFTAFNAPTPSERIVTLRDGHALRTGYEKYYSPLSLNYDDTFQRYIRNNVLNDIYREADISIEDPRLSLGDKVRIAASQGNKAAEFFTALIRPNSLEEIKKENMKIRSQVGYDKTQGLMQEAKLSQQIDPIDQLLNDADTIAELMGERSHSDYINQMAVSARMLSGLYGWFGNKAFGFGENKGDRIATANDMTSTSRSFWDSGYGGIGGDVMEIVRRVIPEYRRFQTKNPLLNNMPDWLPERFRIGDPYTSVPKGEMRLPGRGYESLNKLHPDIFGEYGAFDRYKILADIAPYSPEYKFWKKVAEKTVTSDKLKEEMEEIKYRVREQNKQKDFFEYKYIGRDTTRTNATITEVMSHGQFKIFGSNEVYKLAGVKINANDKESQEEVFKRYIRPGAEVDIVVEDNKAYARNRDSNNSINAAIIINGTSVGDAMLNNGDADKRASDVSIASIHASHGDIVNIINTITEKIMHADIPIIHSRWLRANDPLEDYLDDYVYGSSFQSWDDVVDTFIIPNMRKAASSEFRTAIGITTDIIRNNFISNEIGYRGNNLLYDLAKEKIDYLKDSDTGATTVKASKYARKINKYSEKIGKAADALNLYSDRGSLMGYFLGLVKFGSSEEARFRRGTARRLGSAATLLYSGIENPDSFLIQAMTWSRLGYMLSNDHLGGKYNKLATLAGLAFGVARNLGEIKIFAEEDEDVYIPDSVKKRWELNDYFDRLTYIKYIALSEKAAEEALEKEGVNIKSILLAQKLESKYIRETKDDIKKALAKLDGETSAKAEETKELLRARLRQIVPSRIPVTGGDYTKSAIMYFNAAEATMYGLNESSQMTDIVRALPQTERPYFMAFIKERDEEKRKEILSYVSPQLKKALKLAWYKQYEKPESNEEFFTKFNLPGPTWSGWDPNYDLADIKAKVIKNEGMMASDFGVYASQYSDSSVINAPYVDYNSGGDSYLMSELKISTILNGYGLTDVDVNVEPSEDSTLEVVANIARITAYDIEKGISSFFR